MLLANGSALIVGLSGRSQEVMENSFEIVTILLCASAMVGSSLIAINRPERYRRFLTFQLSLLIAATVFFLIWGISLSTHPVAELSHTAIRETWTVGWLTALAAYTTYLTTRTLSKTSQPIGMLLANLHWIVGALVFVIDVFVFLRLSAPHVL